MKKYKILDTTKIGNAKDVENKLNELSEQGFEVVTTIWKRHEDIILVKEEEVKVDEDNRFYGLNSQ